MTTQNTTSRLRRRAITAAAVVGTLLGAAGIASAAVSSDTAPAGTAQASTVALVAQTGDTTTTPDATTDDTATDDSATDDTATDDSATVDDHGGRVSTEEALTGDLADQVSAAALEAVPGGTIDRVETDDGDAAYEAHMTDADGNHVTVTFDDDLTLIEITEGGRGGPRGHGDGGPRGGSTEGALTGDLADQVTVAALDAVPGGTIDRVETDDGDAAYEAHMTDADGNHVTVTFDDNLTLIEIIEGR